MTSMIPSQSPTETPATDGFDETAVEGGVLHTCRRDAPNNFDQEQYVIRYSYNMTLQQGTDVLAAVSEGENLIGRGVADSMCSDSGNGDPFYLYQLNSKLLDNVLGLCPTTMEGTGCYRVDGLLTASIFVQSTRFRRKLLQQPLSFDDIDAVFQAALTIVLPNVVKNLETFQSIPGSADMGPFGGSDIDDTQDHTVYIITGAIAGAATGLFALSILFMFASCRQVRYDWCSVPSDHSRNSHTSRPPSESLEQSNLTGTVDNDDNDGFDLRCFTGSGRTPPSVTSNNSIDGTKNKGSIMVYEADYTSDGSSDRSWRGIEMDYSDGNDDLPSVTTESDVQD